MRENILNGHGPLMAQYYTWGDGRQIPGDPEHSQGLNANPAQLNDFISEGDTPAYLHLIDTGLRNLDNPTWGGWGGRFTQSPTNPYRVEDLPNTRDFNPYAATTTTTVLPAAAGATTLQRGERRTRSRPGLPITIGTGATAETRTVATVGTAQGANTTLLAPAPRRGRRTSRCRASTASRSGRSSCSTPARARRRRRSPRSGPPASRRRSSGAHAVGATNLKVASVNNLAVGDTLTVDNGANAETVTITAVGTPGATGTGVDVTPALALAHNNNAAVRDQSKPGTGITFSPALAAAHAMNTGVRGAGSGVTLTAPLSAARAGGHDDRSPTATRPIRRRAGST